MEEKTDKNENAGLPKTIDIIPQANLSKILEILPQVERVTFHHDNHFWTYEKADLEQGSYYLTDPGQNKVSAIFPFDHDRPIHDPENNAALWVRNFRAEDFAHKGTYSLEDALKHANNHFDEYFSQLDAFLSMADGLDEKSPDPEKDIDRDR